MVDRPSPSPRPKHMATFVALGASGLLHGALAATFLAWDRGPSPHPAGPAIVVELVSVAPQSWPAGPAQAATTAAGKDIEDATAARPPEEADPQDPVPTRVEPASAPWSEETPPPPATVPAESVSSPQNNPAEPPATKTSVFIETSQKPTPPPELAGLTPPARPKAPARPIEPTTIETTFDRPIAEITPEESSEALSAPPAPAEANPDSGKATAVPDVEMQTAGLPDGEEARDSRDGSAGESGGMFSGPSFRLGSASNPLPRYPSIARRRGWQGRVVLRVEVDTDGHPLSVAVASSSSFPALDEAAGHAVRRWRFEPAQRAGLPVVAHVDVPIVFRLRD